MKILYLRLVNSAGIYAGTSKREIEIDFTKGTNNIVMLFGGNGSGKSTVISSLHPFTGTCNDERDKFFIEGKEGEKEIHYLLEDKVYMIRHYTSAKNKTKSFISVMDYSDYVSKTQSKDAIADKYGRELNENGGVNTFKELVETYLGVDEEFFKISRIGSNVTNFIDLSTANRKKYISNFLPNIEEYLQRYKIVNEKYKVMTKEIKYLSDEILKLDNEAALKTEKTRLEKQLEILRKSLEKCSNQIATIRATVSNLDKDNLLKSFQYENPYTKDLEKLDKEKEKIEEFTKNYSLEDTKKNLELNSQETIEKEKLILQTKERINSAKENLGNISVNIKAKQKQISGMNIQDIANLKKMVVKNDERINLLADERSNLNLESFNIDKLLDVDSGIVYSMKHLYSVLSEEKNKTSIEYKVILEKLFVQRKMSWNKFSYEIEALKQNKENKESDRQNLKNKLTTALSNKKYLTILEKRPSNCVDDSCPFISNALQYQNIESEITELETSIETVNSEIESISNEIDIFENVKAIGNQIERLFNEEKESLKKLNVILKDFSINSFDDLMVYFLSINNLDIKKKLFEGADTLTYYNALNKEIDELEKERDIINDKIKANESIDEIYQELNNELADLNTSLEETSNLISKENKLLAEYTEDLENLEEQAKEYNIVIENFEKEKEFLTNYNDVKTKYDETEDILAEISKLAGDIATRKEEKESYSKQIPIIEEALDSVKLKLSKLKDYTERKKILDENYEKTSWIKDALNPTKGIPVYFIDDYLNRTKFITNNLLDISQHGKFAIAFEVTEKDFFIKVYKNNGDVLSDISQASQGETALTSLSLSLALIEQSMKKYNIFLLDELDGALDVANRRSFIDMVNAQMKILNSEQVFIISHNNEFENIPVDMILLRDNNIDLNNKDFMENKTVLFKV